MAEEIRMTGLMNKKTNDLLILTDRYIYDERGNIIRKKTMEELKEEEKQKKEVEKRAAKKTKK